MILHIGDSIKMKLSDTQGMEVPYQILAIVKDPDNDSDESDMIVFRYWGNHKKRWIWQVQPYWVLAMYNKWLGESHE